MNTVLFVATGLIFIFSFISVAVYLVTVVQFFRLMSDKHSEDAKSLEQKLGGSLVQFRPRGFSTYLWKYFRGRQYAQVNDADITELGDKVRGLLMATLVGMGIFFILFILQFFVK